MPNPIQEQTEKWLNCSIEHRGEVPPFALGNVSRAWTPEETKDALLSWMVNNAEYWATVENKTKREALHGAMFSVCSMFDGCSISMPAFDLHPAPAPEDKQYHMDLGMNYFDPITSAVTGFALHEEYYIFELEFQEKRQERNFKREPGVPYKYVHALMEYIGCSNAVLRTLWANWNLDMVMAKIERLPLMNLGQFESPMNGHQHTLADMVKYNDGWPISATEKEPLTDEEKVIINKIAL